MSVARIAGEACHIQRTDARAALILAMNAGFALNSAAGWLENAGSRYGESPYSAKKYWKFGEIAGSIDSRAGFIYYVSDRLLTMPQHRRANTRDRIEQAAMRLFVDQGVRDTSVRDIARAVDLSEGALYRHFVSKDELVWSLFERHYVDFARELQTVSNQEESPRAKVAAMIQEFCRAHDENPTLFRFLLFVQHGQLAKLTPDALTPVRVIRDVIAAAIGSGEIPEQDPDLATALVFGVVLEPAQFAAYGTLPGRMAPLCERLVGAAWAAVTAV